MKDDSPTINQHLLSERYYRSIVAFKDVLHMPKYTNLEIGFKGFYKGAQRFLPFITEFVHLFSWTGR